METTTQQRLMWQFVTAIQEIVPSYQHVNLEHDELEETSLLQDAVWTYIEAGRERGRAEGIAGEAVRTFSLVWGIGQPAYPGATRTGFFAGGGETFAARLAVAVSYNGVPPQDLESLMTSDAVDLRDTLTDLLDPTVPGLASCEYVGVGNLSVDDAHMVYAEFYFDVTWLQATTT